jgi:hypothetical protein
MTNADFPDEGFDVGFRWSIFGDCLLAVAEPEFFW